MKNKIVIKKKNIDKEINGKKKQVTVLDFFLISEEYGRNYLFTQPFSKGVYDYFRPGRSESELKAYRRWDRNPRLDNLITRIPRHIRYIQMEYAEESVTKSYKHRSVSYDRNRERIRDLDWEIA